MKVTNKTQRIIGVGLTTILPGRTEVVDNKYSKNPEVKRMISKGELKLEVDAPDITEEDKVQTAASIKKMKREELDALAEKMGVEVLPEDTRETLSAKLIAIVEAI